ncbi:5'-nucleotidase [Leptolyngbya ohadii]|uniref:5'-nucleotidase n=1 Tax=Leptolyngbya ohadii TaxID=1962290 RepID=UPI000B59ED45|nr:5'-nucleotidase [Leptolyngbya ohadii]
MAYDLSRLLVIGISSRSLFDLEEEAQIFEEKGLEEYIQHQLDREDQILKPGTAFPLVKGLLALNQQKGERLVEVIVMSRNSPDTGLRIFNSIKHYGLDITRAAFSGGEPLASYLDAFNVDLFLSKSKSDVQAAIDKGFAAALLYNPPDFSSDGLNQVRIAFDADAVLFSEESEAIYKTQGLEAFYENERSNADMPLQEGPFAKLLKTLSIMQQGFEPSEAPVRIAIVTARNSPAHERVIKTLRAWGVRVDAAFFLGGVSKDKVLKAFGAQIFFDDQEVHLGLASTVVPSGLVPYRTNSVLNANK